MDSRINKKAVLIGNGINRMDPDQSLSWPHLLNKLSARKGIDSVDLENDFKPFPLAFEEMLHRKSGTTIQNKTKALKKGVRLLIQDQLSGKEGFNQFHQQVANSSVDDILTTNYEYGFEKSIYDNFDSIKGTLAENKAESKHSIKRRYNLPKVSKKVWHIHGELYNSRELSTDSRFYIEESIMIGYEHYSSYLEVIQQNVNGKSGRRRMEDQSIWARIRNGTVGDSWIDILFTHDVYIFGIGFDFSENHLWWLLNRRADYIKTDKVRRELKINNEILFLYPEMPGAGSFTHFSDNEEFNKEYNRRLKAQAIADVLPALEVKTKKVISDNYEHFYEVILSKYLK